MKKRRKETRKEQQEKKQQQTSRISKEKIMRVNNHKQRTTIHNAHKSKKKWNKP